MRPALVPSLETLETRLFLDVSPVVVSGTVWLDDADGIREPIETGVAGVTVKLRDVADNVVATRVTDSGGAFQFSGQPVGHYSLEFVAPADRLFTLQDRGADDSRDSDTGLGTGRTSVFVLGSVPGSLTFDAGLIDMATALAQGLRITEIMYFPPDGFGHVEEDFEFIELANRGPWPLDLKGVRFIDGVAFDFTGSAVTSLDLGQRVLVVKNRAAIESRYGPGLPIAGEYAGRLNDDGEVLTLVGPINRAIDTLAYWPWWGGDDGGGLSLVQGGTDPKVPLVLGTVPGGTPGIDEGAAVKTAAISGLVCSTVGGGIPNVPVDVFTAAGDLVAATRTTDNGRYNFFGLAPEEYVVKVLGFDGAWWTAPTVTLADRQHNQDVNAALTPPVPLASVRADLWWDMDGDGIWDADEPLAGGESVAYLTDAAGQMVSARLVGADIDPDDVDWRDLVFANLLPGSYRLELLTRDGYALTLGDQGADESLDSDFDPVTGRTDLFTLAPGETLTGLAAGLVYTDVVGNLQDYLRITEIMCNPAPHRGLEPNVDNDDFEFIELTNTGPVALVLTGVRFTDGIAFDFTGSDVQELAPGGHVLVVRNRTAFQARYGPGLPVAGEYDGRLRDEGEAIALVAPINRPIDAVSYSPTETPIAGTSGYGFSMTRNLDYRGSAADEWRPSSLWGGTPGADDPALTFAPAGVVINELRANARTAGGDWIELRNITDAPVYIGGWALVGQQGWYEIPAGTVLGRLGYYVIPESAFNPGGGAWPDDLVLDGVHGGDLLLTGILGSTVPRILERATFGPMEYDATFGRHTKSSGETVFVEMASPTLGGPNGPPMVGPVIINEFMYHPKDDTVEWIELYNRTAADVPLYEPGNPDRTWAVISRVAYEFPAGAVIPAGGYALVVQHGSADWFRQTYAIPPSVPIYPYTCDLGLSNDGDLVRLVRPGSAAWAGTVDPVAQCIVDEVTYTDDPPWPKSPDGYGPSLERIWANAYADDVAYWAAGPVGGTPGRPNSTALAPRVVGVEVNGRPDLGPSGIVPGAGGVRTITVRFSQPVTFPRGAVTVQTVAFVGGTETPTGELRQAAVTGSGTTAMTIALDAGLAVDTWVKVMLKGSAGVPVDAAGRLLDGEPKSGGSGRGYVYGPADLPTGDGAAGGDAILYVGSLPADFNGDGSVGDADLAGFLKAWAAGSPDADFRGEGFGPSAPDGRVTPADLDGFISLYNAAVAGGSGREALPQAGLQSGGDAGPLAGDSGPTPVPSADEVTAASAPAGAPATEVPSPALPEDAVASAAPLAIVPTRGADAGLAVSLPASADVPLAWGSAGEVAPPPDPILAADGGVDLLAMPALTL